MTTVKRSVVMPITMRYILKKVRLAVPLGLRLSMADIVSITMLIRIRLRYQEALYMGTLLLARVKMQELLLIIPLI